MICEFPLLTSLKSMLLFSFTHLCFGSPLHSCGASWLVSSTLLTKELSHMQITEGTLPADNLHLSDKSQTPYHDNGSYWGITFQLYSLPFSYIYQCYSYLQISVVSKLSLLLPFAFARAVPLGWNSRPCFSYGATCTSALGPLPGLTSSSTLFGHLCSFSLDVVCPSPSAPIVPFLFQTTSY